MPKKKQNNEELRKMEVGQEFKRDFAVRMGNVNEESRTISFSFSSEIEAERCYGLEVLSHESGAVRLERINSGGAFLVNHDIDQHVGVIVEGSAIITDGKGRAEARFGNSDESNRIFDDIKNGIRKLISVRYRVHAWEESEQNGILKRTITDWEPTEISTVSIPVDETVGVGRKLDDNLEDIKMPDKKVKGADNAAPQERAADNETQVVRSEPTQTVDTSAIEKQARETARSQEMQRIDSIRSMADEHADVSGADELARQAIDESWDYARFNTQLLSTIGKQNQEVRSKAKDKDGDLDLDGTDQRQFSLGRLMHALAEPQDRNAQRAAEHEFAISDEAAKQFGADFNVRGAYIPQSVLGVSKGQVAEGQRALSEGGTGSGAELIQNNLLAGSYIEVLRNVMVMTQAGATMMPGLKGTVDIPRQLSGASSVWLTAEDEDASESEATFDQVSLSPKDLACYTEVTRRSLMNSTPSMEGIVRNDLIIAQALGIDLAGLYGTGANGQPRGVKNQTGINTVDFAAAQPTFPETVNMVKEMLLDNSLFGSLGYITDPNGWEHGLITEKFASTGKTLIAENGTINGHGYQVSNQIEAGDWFFGNWSDVLIGEWGGLELNVDPYTHSLKGRVRFVTFKTTDVAVRRPQSFTYGSDIA